MRIRDYSRNGVEKALQIGIDVVRPFTKIKHTTPELAINNATDEIDTQDLAKRASHIIDTNPARALFASLVMVELEADRISLEQASYYLTPPHQR
ncbi:hypothetical protein H0X10_03080 [Candidatus Saccharibacteria bacterium]|nr:hypothetical protein [Candidatus Saccharibacteria bacterium]